MHLNRLLSLPLAVKIAATMLVVLLAYCLFFTKGSASSVPVQPAPSGVELSESQLQAVKIEPLGTYNFIIEKTAVGSVAYHERDNATASSSTTKFVVANVSESDSPFIHAGQPVEAKIIVYPDHVFTGRVSALGGNAWDSGGNPAVDPNTHRITVHCEIADPKNELYPGMLATVTIQVQKPVKSPALPMNGVVRKGDGTMTAWVMTDQRHFEERTIKIGLQQDGYDQILDGLKPEEHVVTDGAVFLSNMLYAMPSE